MLIIHSHDTKISNKIDCQHPSMKFRPCTYDVTDRYLHLNQYLFLQETLRFVSDSCLLTGAFSCNWLEILEASLFLSPWQSQTLYHWYRGLLDQATWTTMKKTWPFLSRKLRQLLNLCSIGNDKTSEFLSASSSICIIYCLTCCPSIRETTLKTFLKIRLNML